MLILTRKPGEIIMIGDDTEIHLMGIKGNQVRVGIIAPKDKAVHRREVWLKIQQGERFPNPRDEDQEPDGNR